MCTTKGGAVAPPTGYALFSLSYIFPCSMSRSDVYNKDTRPKTGTQSRCFREKRMSRTIITRRHLLQRTAGLTLAASTFSFASSALAETTLERAKAQGFIRIGFANEAPFGFATPDGKLTGEAPEVAKAVLAKMGITQVDGVLTEFGSLIPGLKAGRFDLQGQQRAQARRHGRRRRGRLRQGCRRRPGTTPCPARPVEPRRRRDL